MISIFTPITNRIWFDKRPILAIFVVSCFFSLVFETQLGPRLDRSIHDIATITAPRTQWLNTALVSVDDLIPLNVGRTQMLPLFALAADRLIESGAKGVFLDARVPLTIDSRLPFAECMESSGRVRWSLPKCSANTDQSCSLRSSAIGRSGPLKMPSSSFENFHYAPPHIDSFPAKYWALFGYQIDAEVAKNNAALDRLVFADTGANSDGIARWYDLDVNHAGSVLAQKITTIAPRVSEQCFISPGKTTACGRVRLGSFVNSFAPIQANERGILPLSQLATCSPQSSDFDSAYIKDRVVILQVSAPLEPIDFHTTAMTTAINGDSTLSAGPQFLADAIETLILNDGPVLASNTLVVILYLLAITVSLISAMYLKGWITFFIPAAISIGYFIISILTFPIVLLPFVGPFFVSLIVLGAVYMLQRKKGMQEARIVSNYLPKKVRSVVLDEGVKKVTFSSSTTCAVLISDIAGYTRFTSLVNNPEVVFNEINRYLNHVTEQVQSECDGWLEGYTGDEVCFYWPSKYEIQAKRKAIQAALLLNELQKNYFSNLSNQSFAQGSAAIKEHVEESMRAGIGLAFGELIMGNIGPESGVKKFGILGDPLNLSSRLEGLTRYFNVDIIIAEPFLEDARSLGLAIRKLACIKVKGRTRSENIYAIATQSDHRFKAEDIQCWEAWVEGIEKNHSNENELIKLNLPIYEKDIETIQQWYSRGLLNLETMSWHLDEK